VPPPSRTALRNRRVIIEWVEVKLGERTIHAFVVYPEVKTKALTVIVIHENRGLNDWARSVADRLAENGYIAIAPDLLSGAAPGGGRTKDFPAQSAATEAIGKLKPADVTADLGAIADVREDLAGGQRQAGGDRFLLGRRAIVAVCVRATRIGVRGCVLRLGTE